ncbi:MAG TPA: cytochrome P450 [Polyangiales bacterium]|nr:cytochrome P450 [Polyangiales bacterium]
MTLLPWVAGSLFVGSLPYWLPQQLVALRMRLFTHINGENAVAIPGQLVDASRFKQVYSHPAADGRSRGAALSDLFWYWLSPGPEIHQEHLEPGARYDAIAHTTRRILALPRQHAEELTARCVARALDERGIERATLVRLRDVAMPVWAELYYEVVFGRACDATARELIVANANDVVTALKCCGLRHMDRRHRLTQFLLGKLRVGELPHELPQTLSDEERALYLQGVFFNTAVVQMSEATAHLLLLIAQHPDVQARLFENPDDHDYLDRVITEALRVYPLFGISHRITSAPIELDEATTIPAGSVLCFEHPEFHRHGFTDPERFDPERWQQLSTREANYIPFGVTANRPCPAQGLALITLRVAAREVLRRFALRSSARHTRSLPSRGPCLLVPRTHPEPKGERAFLLWMRVRDRWEDVGRSVVQLVLGTYMVWQARKLRLCQRYFEQGDEPGGAAPNATAGACPAAQHSAACR